MDVIGPHVAEGHYDLVGPNGEILLPQVWESMVEPDCSITMHMWPFPEAEQEAAQKVVDKIGLLGKKLREKEKETNARPAENAKKTTKRDSMTPEEDATAELARVTKLATDFAARLRKTAKEREEAEEMLAKVKREAELHRYQEAVWETS